MDKDLACRILFVLLVGAGIIIGTKIFVIGAFVLAVGILGLLICDHMPNINYYMASDLARYIEAYSHVRCNLNYEMLQSCFKNYLGWNLVVDEGEIVRVCR